MVVGAVLLTVRAALPSRTVGPEKVTALLPVMVRPTPWLGATGTFNWLPSRSVLGNVTAVPAARAPAAPAVTVPLPRELLLPAITVRPPTRLGAVELVTAPAMVR